MRTPVLAVMLSFVGPAAAEPEPPEVPHALAVAASATSTSKMKSSSAAFALGSDPAKLWCEGKPDEGLGEALVLKLAAPTRIESLTIRAGVWRSPELFRANNRITELRVVTDDGRDKKVLFREERENVEVSIDRTVSEIRLEIMGVAKGRVNDTCISGIDLHTDPPSSIVFGADAAAAAALEPAFAKVWHAFATCDEGGLRAQLRFPFVSGKRFSDARAVRKACEDGAFTVFQPRDASLRLRSLEPGKLMLLADTLEWHFALAGKTWLLTGLVDQRL